MASKRTIWMVCNYLMAGTAVAMCAYIFSFMFSSTRFGELPAIPQQNQSRVSVPASSVVTEPPAKAKEQASHAIVSNGNVGGGQAPATNAGVQQPRAAAPASPTGTSAPPIWGDAPHVLAGPPIPNANRQMLPPGFENEDNSLTQAPQKIKK
ncbi:MAG: hypothetical protein ABSH28_15885 [Acidobacteriota bacterium]